MQPASYYIKPYSYNDYYLGHADYIWKGLYVNNAYINNTYTNYIKRDNTGDLTIETTNGHLHLAANTTGSSTYVYLDGNPATKSGNLYPKANETYNIGESNSNRYLDLYVKYITCHQIGAELYVDISDRRRKENIKPLDKGIEFIKKLEPKKFNFKNNIGIQYGLIAQDTELIDEDKTIVIPPRKQEDDYMMNYKALIPVLIKAMQEQQKMIEDQQLTINELEKKINILTA
jgi:hypothetical protein